MGITDTIGESTRWRRQKRERELICNKDILIPFQFPFRMLSEGNSVRPLLSRESLLALYQLAFLVASAFCSEEEEKSSEERRDTEVRRTSRLHRRKHIGTP